MGLGKTVEELVEKRDTEGLRHALSVVHPADIADVIANLEAIQANWAFQCLPEAKRVETFEELEESDQLRLLEAF